MAEIDALTMPEFAFLAAYWRRHPPAHLVLAAMAGIRPPERGGLEELRRVFGVESLSQRERVG